MSIAGRSAEEISARIEYFRHIIEKHVSLESFSGLDLLYHEQAPAVLTDVYFGITGAYKEIYLKSGNRTDHIKQAAFVCASIAAVSPIRANPDAELEAALESRGYYVNAMLGILAGSSLVGHPFRKRGWDDQRRAFDAFCNYELDCVTSFLASGAGSGSNGSEFVLSDRDQNLLSSAVLQFSLYSQMKEPHQASR